MTKYPEFMASYPSSVDTVSTGQVKDVKLPEELLQNHDYSLTAILGYADSPDDTQPAYPWYPRPIGSHHLTDSVGKDSIAQTVSRFTMGDGVLREMLVGEYLSGVNTFAAENMAHYAIMVAEILKDDELMARVMNKLANDESLESAVISAEKGTASPGDKLHIMKALPLASTEIARRSFSLDSETTRYEDLHIRRHIIGAIEQHNGLMYNLDEPAKSRKLRKVEALEYQLANPDSSRPYPRNNYIIFTQKRDIGEVQSDENDVITIRQRQKVLVEIPSTMRRTVRDVMKAHPGSNASIVLQQDQEFMDALSSIADTSSAVVISSIYYAFKNVNDSAVEFTVSDLYNEINNDPDMTAVAGPPTPEVTASIARRYMVRRAMQHPRVLEYLESLDGIPELDKLHRALGEHKVARDTIGAAVVRLIGRMNPDRNTLTRQ